jgi:hypothetical protein
MKELGKRIACKYVALLNKKKKYVERLGYIQSVFAQEDHFKVGLIRPERSSTNNNS